MLPLVISASGRGRIAGGCEGMAGVMSAIPGATVVIGMAALRGRSIQEYRAFQK